MTCKQIQDKIHNDYINRCDESIAFGFAVCIAIQLMHEEKDVEQYLPEICNYARKLIADDNSPNTKDRQQLISELLAFEYQLDVGVPVSLLSADTDKVKSYVFESAKLPEVRGASIILDELNRTSIVKEVFTGKDCQPPEECIIYNSGGGLLAIVPTCWAKRIGMEIERLYLDRTKVATITTVTRPFHLCEYRFGLRADQFTFDQFRQQWANADEQRKRLMMNYYGLEETDDTEKLWDKFCETKGFGELVRQMSADLKAAKYRKGYAPFFEAGHFIRACDSCELRPAFIQDTIEDEIAYLCKICYDKRDVGRREKGRIVNENLIEYFQNRPCEFSQYYFELPMRIAPPRDLKEIGACSRPSGFVGIIYADGDNVGKTLENLQTPSKYQDFSHKMDKATKEAVFGTIVQRGIKPVFPSDKSKYEGGKNRQRIQVVSPADNEQLETRRATKEDDELELRIHSFEAISVGGDDLVLIVPGHHAMWTALEICELFGQQMQDEKITMSAGVVIASDNYPVYYLFDLASQLQKSAKKESREASEGAIDFMVMTAQNTLSSQIADYRKEFMERKIPEDGSEVREKLCLTARPYRLSKLCILLKWIEKFKAEDYPTSQLYGLVQSLQEHARQHSTLRFLYQWYRHKQTHTKLLGDFMASWKIEQASTPWMKSQGELPFQEFFTYFVDLLEIYQFV